MKLSEALQEATVRFAGDSGDGMQLTGTQFTHTAVFMGNDVATLPDFPAEIRSPAGTLFGVSAFQVKFGSTDIHTPGDECDVLVAMNPAALKTNLHHLIPGGIIIANTSNFTAKNLRLARYEQNPLEDDSLNGYKVYGIELSRLTALALEDTGLTPKQTERCKNFFALGLSYWMFNRSIEPTIDWIKQKFADTPEFADANVKALKAGYNFGITTDMIPTHYSVGPAKLKPGKYRNITGNHALAIGLVAAGMQTGRPLFLGSYPITPASDVLHQMSRYKEYGVKTFQAEDEIAAISSAIGASFAGNIGVTTTSGPGLSLKSEALGLAIMVELPLIVVDIQRGGPSTGLPTKTEQSDLNLAVFGRHGEAPAIVLAAKSPADCFDVALEAVRLSTKYTTPVIILSDVYIANGAEPWNLPAIDRLPSMSVKFATEEPDFQPYTRDHNFARPWAIPGTPGLEHRIGGLEKADLTGNVSYDPANHQRMVQFRQQKVDQVAADIPDLTVYGDLDADLLIASWGSTYGAIRLAVDRCRAQGYKLAHVHFTYLNPMPRNSQAILKSFPRVLVPEINNGQLLNLLRARYFVPAIRLNKIMGLPFKSAEIEQKIKEILGEEA